MSQKANYFKLGLFVIIGMAFGVAGLIVFGVGTYFHQGVLVETYLDESVQGLEVGSPVKYRGVHVGSVESIQLGSEVYRDIGAENMVEGFGRYVYVLMRLDKEALHGRDRVIDQTFLDKRAGEGMRIRLTQLGITGIAYLGIDFFDPEEDRPLEISWHAQNLYLPSAPSLIAKVSTSVETVFQTLESIDVGSISDNLNKVLILISHQADPSQADTLGARLKDLLGNLAAISKGLEKITSDPALGSILANTATTVESARELVDLMKENIVTLVRDLGESSRNLQQISHDIQKLTSDGNLKTGLADFSVSMGNLEEASRNVPEAMTRLNTVLIQVNNLVSRQGSQIEAILENLEHIARNLNEITQNARKDPGGVFLNEPPPRRVKK